MITFFEKYVGIKNFIFLVLAILFIIFMIQIKDIAILFFAAFVIACSLNPIVDKLCSKFKKLSRTTASAVVLLSTLFIGFLFFVPIILIGGEQISLFINHFPSKLEQAKEFLTTLPFISNTNLQNINIGEMMSSASDVTSNIVSQSILFSKGVASFLVYFLAACIIIYYFLADKSTVRKAYLSLFPHNLKAKADDIMKSISHKVGGYVLAQVVTLASVGVIMFIGLAILGVDYAIILGLITAVFDLVPVIGPAVAFAIILIAVLKMGALKIGLVVLVFLFAQWVENNLVRPYVFGKLLDIHPLIIYFFLLVTAQYLGIIGVIFAPAIAATFCVLLEELYIKNVN